MVNQALAEEIRLQRRKFRQKKEDYEDCCNAFKKELEEEEQNLNNELRATNYYHEECHQMQDKQLLAIIEQNIDYLNDACEIHDELSKTSDMALKSYLYEYEGIDDDLRIKLNQLEGL